MAIRLMCLDTGKTAERDWIDGQMVGEVEYDAICAELWWTDMTIDAGRPRPQCTMDTGVGAVGLCTSSCANFESWLRLWSFRPRTAAGLSSAPSGTPC